MNTFEKLLKNFKTQRQQDGLWRELPSFGLKSLPGRWLDLTHNKYLGPSLEQAVYRDLIENIGSIPIGSGASRLLNAYNDVYLDLEQTFAQWKQAPSALYLATGYVANLALITTLAHFDGVFYSDQLNHASIIDGFKLARVAKTQRFIYEHKNLNMLEDFLQKSSAPLKVIYTESLFSMDGDIAPLAELNDLAKQYEALLVIDEAHALGCWSERGEGLIKAQGIDHQQPHIISVNPCGKALSSQGAMICARTEIKEMLVNLARPFIYSTAPSPLMAYALKQLCSSVQKADGRRSALFEQARLLRHELQKKNLTPLNQESYIVPLPCENEHHALWLKKYLQEHHQVIVQAIRPPTVPRGGSRLRLSVHADLSQDHIMIIANSLGEAYEAYQYNKHQS